MYVTYVHPVVFSMWFMLLRGLGVVASRHERNVAVHMLCCGWSASSGVGVLCGQVYVWKVKGAFNRDFFEAADDWPLLNEKEKWLQESMHRLKEVMEFLTRDDPAAKVRQGSLCSICRTSCNSVQHSDCKGHLIRNVVWTESARVMVLAFPAGHAQ